MPIIDDPGDVVLSADTAGDGVGSIILSTGGVERARILPNGTGSGLFSGSSSGSSTTTSITQTGHGLVVGDVVRFDGSSYVKAKADSAAAAEVVGIVSAVASPNAFTLSVSGLVTNLSGLSAGSVYFLDPSTAGALTATEPTSNGQVSKPLLISVSTTSGYFVNMRGEVLSGTSADIYIATTGNDTTGDGSSGTPYATLAKALQQIPQVLDKAYTIHVSDGTYAEPINLQGFIGDQDKLVKITGNTTTPANVKFTGAQAVYVGGDNATSVTTVAVVSGSVFAELEGLTLQGDGSSQTTGLLVQEDAFMVVDRCTIKTSSGSFYRGVYARHRGQVQFNGNCTIQNWSTLGITAQYHSELSFTVAGTLTLTGPGTSGYGIHLFGGSGFICETASTNITITGARYGFQMGLHARFQHVGSSSTITIDNASTPASSAAVQATDLSTWSASAAVVIDNFTYGWEMNSISYGESTGSRTITNVTGNSSTSQNSVVLLA